MKSFIIEKLRHETDDNNLLEWWNEYDSATNASDGLICTSLEEWAEILGDEPAAFARRVYFGDVGRWDNAYFWLDGYGNFRSSDYLTDDKSPIDFESLARWLIEEGSYSIVGDWINEWGAEHAEAEE